MTHTHTHTHETPHTRTRVQPQEGPEVIGLAVDEPQQPRVDNLPSPPSLPAPPPFLLLIRRQDPGRLRPDFVQEAVQLLPLDVRLRLVGQEVFQAVGGDLIVFLEWLLFGLLLGLGVVLG